VPKADFESLPIASAVCYGHDRMESSSPMRDVSHWPQLILVNGPSSAGKTTLCRALQDKIPHPYLVTGFDDFIFMAAPRYYRGADTARQSDRNLFTA
jgi:chloramphenicol 3-O-phosphotransferase